MKTFLLISLIFLYACNDNVPIKDSPKQVAKVDSVKIVKVNSYPR